MALEKIALEFVHFTESSLVMEFFEWMQHYLECQNYCKDSNLFTRWWSIYSDFAKKKCGVGALGFPRINVWVVPLQSHALSVADSWSPTTFELTVVAKYWNCRPEHYYSHLCSTLFHHCWGHGQSLTLSLVSSQCVVYNRWKGEKRFLGISTYYAQWCGNVI